MYIDEIKGGMDVSVRATNMEGQSLYFTSKTIDKFTERDEKILESAKTKLSGAGYRFVAVELFRDYDAILSFIHGLSKLAGEIANTSHIYCEATFQGGDKPCLFKKVKILRMNLKDAGVVHLIICPTECTKINRRTEYRVPLYKNATMRIESGDELYNVTLRDISASGIGILIRDDFDIEIDDSVHIEFYDTEYDKKKRMNIETIYKIDANVVRIVDIDDKRRLIGLSVSSQNNELGKLINKKQMDMAKSHHKQ